LVSAAAEFVKTGVLKLFHNNLPVLHWNVSPPDSDQVENSWVARGIEEFKDGEWVADLTQLHSRLVNCETDQKNKDELAKREELKGIAELKEKLSRLLPVRAEPKSWFLRLLRRSGS
jgi:hypothetical protein